MHAHGVHILDRADDNGVVGAVAHDLHLEFLPTDDGFFDQHFVGGRNVETMLHDVEEFLAVIGDAAAGAPERERGADDRRQSDFLQRLQRVRERFR